MLRRLRVYAKTPLIAASTCGLYAAWRALRGPLERVGLERPWRRLMLATWARTSLAVLGVRVRVDGAPPEGAAVLVTNHLTYLDIALLAARHDCVFVSMAEVVDWPIMGRIARDLETVFVERTRRRDAARANDEIADRLARGYTVVLFPEGRSSDGAEVGEFHGSLLEPAARLGLPVAYAALGYATRPGDPPAGEAVCWTSDASFGQHMLGLMRLGRVEARVAYGAAPVVERDRKRLAALLEAAVRARFEPTTAPPSPAFSAARP